MHKIIPKNMKKGVDKFRKMRIIVFVRQNIAGLCNGSTADSDSVCEGSNPSPAAIEKPCNHNGYRVFSCPFFGSYTIPFAPVLARLSVPKTCQKTPYALSSLPHVAAPTTPSTVKPLAFWYFRTAASVPLPKSPSAPAEPQEYCADSKTQDHAIKLLKMWKEEQEAQERNSTNAK